MAVNQLTSCCFFLCVFIISNAQWKRFIRIPIICVVAKQTHMKLWHHFSTTLSPPLCLHSGFFFWKIEFDLWYFFAFGILMVLIDWLHKSHLIHIEPIKIVRAEHWRGKWCVRAALGTHELWKLISDLPTSASVRLPFRILLLIWCEFFITFRSKAFVWINQNDRFVYLRPVLQVGIYPSASSTSVLIANWGVYGPVQQDLDKPNRVNNDKYDCVLFCFFLKLIFLVVDDLKCQCKGETTKWWNRCAEHGKKHTANTWRQWVV